MTPQDQRQQDTPAPFPTQSTPPATPPPPTPTASPAPAPVPSPGSPYPPQQQPYVPQPPKRGPSGLKIFLIIGGVLFLIGALIVGAILTIGAIGYNQVKSVSDNFITALENENIDEAAKYLKDPTAEDKQFLQSVAETLGSGERRDEGFDIATKNGASRGYFLYSYTEGTNRYARVTVEDDNGWFVTNMATSEDRMSVVPGDETADTGTTEPAPVARETPSGTCLAASDFDTIYRSINGAARPASMDYSGAVRYMSNVQFGPDSLEFSTPAAGQTNIVNSFGTFGSTHKGKDFTIELQGSVATTARADLDFAAQRADKIKNMLVAKGTDPSDIVVKTPQNISSFGGDPNSEVNKRTARTVVLTINPTCSGGDNTSGR